MRFDVQIYLTNREKSHIIIVAHLPCVEGVPKDVLQSKASFACIGNLPLFMLILSISHIYTLDKLVYR